MTSLRLLLCTWLVLMAPASVVRAAEHTDPAAAQTLFEEGLVAFDAGRVDEACAKFQESMRLDPADGTLLNLARCNEKQGKTATAWSQYTDVAARSVRSGDEERAAIASRAADRLLPKLPKLRVVVPHAVPDLVIAREGVTLAETSWGKPLPVDPGRHRITATAPGWQPISVAVDVQHPGMVESVVLPEMAPNAKVPLAESPRPAEDDHALMVSGIVFASTGLTAGIVGAVLGGMSLSELSDARDDPALCPNNVCTPRGREQVEEATSKGDASTALFVVGGVLAATGVSMIVVDLLTDDDDGERRAAVRVAPGPGQLGVGLDVSF
jgi:hypothetical protein